METREPTIGRTRAIRLGAVFAAVVIAAICLQTARATPAEPAPDWGEEPSALSPSARSGPAMAYDEANREMVLFGGITEAGVRFDDTWTWDGEDWSRKSPAHSPSARSSARMAFDSSTGQLLLVGGTTADGLSDETWTWNGSDWTELTPAPAAFNPSVAYDPVTGSVLFFGGRAPDGSYLDHTWSWNGSDWTELAPATSPPARWGATMGFDPESETMVLYGGIGDRVSHFDTWTWDGTAWTEQFPANLPTPINDSAMAYSPTAGSLIMLSGTAEPAAGVQTWSWDGSDWSRLGSLTSPPARFSAAMGLDQANGKVLLFGGLTMEGAVLGDTWTFGVQADPAPIEEIPPPGGEDDERPDPVCHKVNGGLSLRSFPLTRPFGKARPVTGLRIRISARGDVNAKIAPRIIYPTRSGPRSIGLRPRTIRIDRNRDLRFALPRKVRIQMRRSAGPVRGSRVRVRLRARLKSHGDRARCFRTVASRAASFRVTTVSSRVALRRR